MLNKVFVKRPKLGIINELEGFDQCLDRVLEKKKDLICT
jgi:hypothetical protein